MKKLFFLLFFPILSFSQTTEKQQKEEVRSTGTYKPSTTFQQPQRPSYTQQNNEFLQKNSVREQSRSYISRSNPKQPIIYDPYWNYGSWGWNRWNPMFGWNSYSPYFWYDSWGYRNPGRIYIYENGVRDTLKRQTPHGSLGLQYNTRHEYGIFGLFGKKTYFLVEYTQTNNNNIGVYYPLLTLDRVLPWNDRKLSDEIRSNMFYLGFGKKLDKRVGVHMSLGFGKEERRYKFYDELFILSNNGEYTFPNYQKNLTTLKIGTTIDASRNFLVKLDYDLGRGCIFYGLGLRF